MKRINLLILIIINLIVFTILTFCIKGLPGNPNQYDLNSNYWSNNGPFQLSPERGRFALLYSLIENKSFYFSVPLARFAIPDLGYKNGFYVSLFAPGVSFIAIPGYLIGKLLGASQVGAFSVSAIFAFLNFILIQKIAFHLSQNKISSFISALVFLFATPAFAYAGVLYQHHISTFLILLSLNLLTLKTHPFWQAAVFFLCAASIPIDYPNLFLMLPIGLAAIFRLIYISYGKYLIQINFRFRKFLVLIGLVPPLFVFLWFNYQSYANPLQFSGTVASIKEIDDKGLPTTPKKFQEIADPEKYLHPELQNKSAVRSFQTRNLINGLYIHLISPDRGLIIFTPILLLGLYGYYILWRDKNPLLPTFVSIPIAGLTLYSLWGDPWGGWAFGSRYLIPVYAALCLPLAVVITAFRKKIIFILLFSVLFIYSAGVNLTGALTSIANPPQIEAGPLGLISGKPERYSWDRNFDHIKNNRLGSYIYNQIFSKYLPATTFYWLTLAVISSLTVSSLLWQKLKLP